MSDHFKGLILQNNRYLAVFVKFVEQYPTCPMEVAKDKVLYRYWRIINNLVEPEFVCMHCYFVGTNKGNYNRHIREICPLQKPEEKFLQYP